MLVLSRKPGEAILLTLESGEEIRISVEGLNMNRAKVGIAAPRHVTISRPESPLKVKSEGRA
jgi:carbon storage regulator CsrA